MARVGRRGDAGRPALAKRARQSESPAARARCAHALGKFVGNEGRDFVAPARLSPEMGGQADLRVVAARDRNQVGRHRGSSPVPIDNFDAAHALAAAHVGDRRSQMNPRRPRETAHRRRDFGPRVDDRRDAETRRAHVGGRAPAVVARREDHGVAAARHGEAVEIGSYRRGQRHARPIVAAECDRPLERAGGQHRALGDDAPEPLARLMQRRRRKMIRDALQRAIDAAVVDAEYRRSPENPNVAERRQFPRRIRDPLDARPSVDLESLGVESAAELEIVVGENDASPCPTRGERGVQPRGTAADDQHVAMREGFLILVGIGLAARPSQPRGAADQRLVELFPERRRPHEGLVVEARDQDRRRQRIDRAEIEAQ